jgi:uncharacterized phage protein (TIGR01671 family)
MREILFRGKRVDNGEWVYGYYENYNGGSYINLQTDRLNSGGYPIREFTEVIPETVGQFTGLTDKNGKRIFEGDIVKREFTLWHGETKKTRETQIGVVAYSNRECGFQVEKKCNLRKPWDGDTIQVIGNIHDNGELFTAERR